MDTQNQFTVFALCLLVGFVGGICYEVFSLIRICFGCQRGKNKQLGIVLDVLFFAVFAVFCTVAAYAFDFPAFRVYMWVGYLCGGIIYSKSLHKIIAFFENVCYNGINKMIKKAKNRDKTLSKEEKIV